VCVYACVDGCVNGVCKPVCGLSWQSEVFRERINPRHITRLTGTLLVYNSWDYTLTHTHKALTRLLAGAVGEVLFGDVALLLLFLSLNL